MSFEGWLSYIVADISGATNRIHGATRVYTEGKAKSPPWHKPRRAYAGLSTA